MFKRIVILALMCALIIGAKTGGKTYSFNLKDPAVAGSTQLKAGDYRLKVDGDQVTLTDSYGKVIDAKVKLETSEKKFDDTAILSAESDGTRRIICIQLKGSTYSAVFE